VTRTPPPTQDKLAEIEADMQEASFIMGETRVYSALDWLIAEVKRLRGDNATLSSYIYSMTNPGTLPEVLRGSMQRVEQ